MTDSVNSGETMAAVADGGPYNDETMRLAADRIHGKEGTCEIDETALVSRGADNGAYVAAWVWVYDSDVEDGDVSSKPDVDEAPAFTVEDWPRLIDGLEYLASHARSQGDAAEAGYRATLAKVRAHAKARE